MPRKNDRFPEIRLVALALAVTAACIAPATQAFAQGMLFEKDSRSMIPEDHDWTRTVSLGDVDGDGDPDALFGSCGAQNRLYLNDGNGVFTDASDRIPEASGLALALGDVDGDGDLDAFLGCWGGQNRLYLNDGSGDFTDATAQLPIDEDWTEVVVLGDVDSDGDLDALVGNSGSQNRLYLNDGSGAFEDATVQIPMDSDITKHIVLGDVDGDGDLDAFLSNGTVGFPISFPQQNRLYLNDGTGVFSDATSRIPAREDFTSAIALGDVDGDGDLDAFIGNGYSNCPDGVVRDRWDFENHLYLNDGVGFFSDATPQIPDHSENTLAAILADADGDGDLDVFLGNGGSEEPRQNRLYLNDGNGFFADAADQIPDDAQDTGAVAVGDVDGDGDLDVLLGNMGQDRLYLNDGDGVFTDTASPIAVDDDWTLAVAIGDVDGDTDLDALLGNAGRNRLYLNDGNGIFTDATPQIPEMEEYSRAVALEDLDGDGDLDAFVGNHFGHPDRIFLNNGDGVFVDATSQIPNDDETTTSIALGDVDGDGDVDAYLGRWDAQNRLYLNDGYGVFTDATTQIPVDHLETTAIVLGDVDGDGDLDCVIGNEGFGSSAQNLLYVNDGAGVFTRAVGSIPPHYDSTNAVALGDVDGDGDLDVFIGNGTEASGEQDRLYLNDGLGVFSDATSRIPAQESRTFAIALGDVDGDGDLDALLGRKGQNRLYLNDGAGFFADATPQIPVDSDWTRAVALDDLDGDDDLDAFVAVGEDIGTENRIYTNLTRQLSWRGIPRIGKRLDLDLYGPADGTYILGISRRQTYRPKPPRGVLKIHPGYVLHTKEGTLDSDGHALLTYDLPDDPSLVGKSFYWQALVKSPGRFTNLEITTLTDL